MKKIVILGGGYGGVLTAKKIERKLKKEDVSITLIDKNPYHTMLTELHEVAARRVDESAIKMEFKKIFAHRKVNFELDEVTEFDFKSNKLRSNKKEYDYDYLVVGTGSKPRFFGVKGAEENAFTLWSYDDAVDLKYHMEKMFRMASKTHDEDEIERLLTFVTVGAGFTGVEMAGEIAELREELCHMHEIDESKVKIYVVDMADEILPMFPKDLAGKARRRLEKIGVQVLTNAGCKEVSKDFIDIDAVGKIPTHTVIWAAGTQGSDVINNNQTELMCQGRIRTNEYLQSIQHENVYVVGDNVYFVPEGEERSVPQMVENAEHSAGTVSKNIVATIKGTKMEKYEPHFHGAMVCIGSRYGVARVGTPNRMINLTGFLAMFTKHFINLIYFIQVLGIHKIYEYLKHEVFSVHLRRSFTGGYLSNKNSVFWQVPLRIYLGYMWLVQGLDKFPKIIEDFNHVFLIPAPPTDGVSEATAEAVETAVDAVSNASSVAEAAADAVTALPVPEFIAEIVEWSMELMFYSNGDFTLLAKLFQAGMVTAEIVVGAMLILGLLTPLAAVVSILMGMMIWFSGMAPTEMVFYLLGGIAIMFSGNSFGLDYYVFPWLKRKLATWKFTKKWYLYIE